ncbi:site-specific integrase [Elizabethkingia meningoseptica]|uniref:site-specific integrase n=1 Tax=Elizabethkingia meningoseptica TaxID=238 RepID=UPI0018C31679|nr:site-specific integrase [Elizabethkingia meningoseptica]MBG0515292.1 site-specific integrase [Elizabethkingia meningoseptica]
MIPSELDLYKSLEVKKLYKPMRHTFYLKNEPDKEGTCPIYINISQNGDRKRLPIEIRVPKESWDTEKRKVVNHEKESDLNLLLAQIKSRITQIKIDFRLKNEPLTVLKVANLISNANYLLHFHSFFKYIIKEESRLSPSTIRKHIGIFEKLEEYQPNLTFGDIDLRFFERYRKWLKDERKNVDSTINSNIGVLKKYLYIAEDYGIILSFDADKISVGGTGGRIIYLHQEELNKLKEYYFSGFIPDHFKLTLGYFLFSCYTGLRVSDVMALTREHVTQDYLDIIPKKTQRYNIRVYIKINPICRKIIDHYPALFNEKKAETNINDQLKEIATACGIKKNVSFNVGRHTFGTTYILKNGSVRKLMELMGHRKIETTMKYVHITRFDAADSVDILE